MAQNNSPKIPRNVIVLSFVALFSGFGQDIITPVLPLFLSGLGFTTASIGLIDGLLQGAVSIFRFISGVLSDKFQNRKFFVALGYTMSSIVRPLLAFANHFGFVAFTRITDGAGKGMKDAPRDSLIASSTENKIMGKSFGFARLVDTIGSVFGPLTAAAILLALSPSLHTYRLIFLVSALPGAIALLLIFLGVKEPKNEIKKVEKKKLDKNLGVSFWIFTIITTIAMFIKINDSLFLLRAHESGISQANIPLLFAGFTLIYALLSYPLGILSDKVGKLSLITVGWLVLAIAELMFALTSSLIPLLIIFALYGIFYALTEGSDRAFIAEYVEKGLHGAAYGVFYTLTGIAVIFGGYFLGHIWDAYSPQTAFLVSAIGSALVFVVFLIINLVSKKKLKTN